MAWIKVGATTLADTIHNWNDSTDTGCVISGNDISPASGFTGWNACQAKSSTGITRGGEMSFTIHTSAEGFSTGAGYWGIDEGTTVLTGTTGFDYYMYVDGGVSNVVAYDSNGNSSTTYAKGDILSISIDSSGNVLFKNNGTTFRTSSVTAGTNTYYAQYLSLRSGSGGFGGKDLIASGASNNLDITGKTVRNFNQFLHHEIPTGGDASIMMTLNNDATQKYARRTSHNGGTDGEAPNESNLDIGWGNADPKFYVHYWIDIAGEEKLGMAFGVNRKSAGAGNATQRVEHVLKYTDTSASITRVDTNNTLGGSYKAGSNISALGTD